MLLTVDVPTVAIDLDPTQDWPAQGDWTYDDYLRLPDDGNRYEIIQGVLYVQAAPLLDHQHTLMVLAAALYNHVTANKLGMVYPAPIEIRLDPIARPVQPDIIFISRDRVPVGGIRKLNVVPDIAVEILSQSTRRYDSVVKFAAYEAGGVREYWLVDTEALTVTIYALPEEGEQYALVGLFKARDDVRSTVLTDLVLPVHSLFPD